MYFNRITVSLLLINMFAGLCLQAQQQPKTQPVKSSVATVKDTLKPSGNIRCYNIPKLSQDQEIKIDQSRIAMQKERNQLLSRIGEKETNLKRMTSEEEGDPVTVDKINAEIAFLKDKITKAEDKHIQEVRAALTEEQKIFFDSRPRPDFGKGQVKPVQTKKHKRVPAKGPACM